MKQLLFILLIFISFQSANANECSYTLFTPEFLRDKLDFEMNANGIGAWTSHNDFGTFSQDKSLFYRGNSLIGEMTYQTDAQLQHREFIMRDTRSLVLLKVIAKRMTPTSEFISIFSDFNQTANSRPSPFLQILNFSTSGLFHYWGGRDVGIAMFYYEFEKYWNLALGDMNDPSHSVPVVLRSPLEAFQFAAATRPEFAPYARYFKAVYRTDHFELEGSVPSSLYYQAILRAAQEAFGYGTIPRLTIDGRLTPTFEVKAPRC
jgi:hypothetical protein